MPWCLNSPRFEVGRCCYCGREKRCLTLFGRGHHDVVKLCLTCLTWLYRLTVEDREDP